MKMLVILGCDLQPGKPLWFCVVPVKSITDSQAVNLQHVERKNLVKVGTDQAKHGRQTPRTASIASVNMET